MQCTNLAMHLRLRMSTSDAKNLHHPSILQKQTGVSGYLKSVGAVCFCTAALLFIVVLILRQNEALCRDYALLLFNYSNDFFNSAQ